FSCEVADNHPVGTASQDVVRIDRHFAAAARGVDDVLGDGVARGVTAQAFHNLQALPHAGAQVGGTGDEVALVEVVWLDSAHEKLVQQGAHHDPVIVHMPQKDRLIAQRD